MNRILRAGCGSLCRPGSRLFLLLLLVFFLTGCAGRLQRAGDLFYQDRPEQALELLEKGDYAGKRNRLLFLMEQGAILHHLQRYKQSTQVLLQAAEQIDADETIRVGEQAGSLVTNEWLLRYRGEYSERLWVHSYQMMNFLLLGLYDDALVEAKQALDVLGAHEDALRTAYFTRALIGLCFDNVAEENDAHLVYRRLAVDLPSPQPVAADLVRLSRRLGMSEEVQRYQSSLPSPLPSGEAELVLFIANGRIAGKLPGNVVVPPSIRFSFPYYERHSTAPLRLRIEPERFFPLPILSTDLSQVAARSLDERKASLIVKESARVAAKEAIARSVGKDHGGAAEALVRISLFILEEPDVRSWLTLPGRLSLVRIPLPAGRHQLTLQLSNGVAGQAREIGLNDIELRKGQRIFRSLRF